MQSPQDHAEVILALDIGGTFIKSAVFRDGVLLRKLPQIPSCSAGRREEIASAIRTAVGQAGAVDRIAVSIPGPFDYASGKFLMTHKFAAVKDAYFSEFSGGTPACFIHDANAFLLGEVLHGAGRGFLRVGGVTLGTGLGAAFAVGGKPLKNAQGSPSGEVSIWNRPYRDGIAEDYVSARALLRDFPGMDGKMLAEAAAAGDARAGRAWREYSADLYRLLGEWKDRLEPEVIVVGGQLRKGLAFGTAAPAELHLRFSELGEDAALWGAYEAARESMPLAEPTEAQLRRAILATGDAAPYQAFLKRAERGETLTVGVLGGSITAGAACSEPDKRYHGVLLEYLRRHYPKSRFSLVNAGIGATDSIYGAFRAERDLLSKRPDLVILEFAVNDTDASQWASSYEGTVRQILTRGCPLIQLFMTRDLQHNCQRFQEVIGRHYGLAAVSLQDAVMPELMSGKVRWDQLSPDAIHPNPATHTFTGKLLCALFDRIAALPERPAAALPEPLFSDEFQHTFLLERDTFQPGEHDGWEETPGAESQNYWFRRRWFASRPGSTMRFAFEGTSLWISYLGIQGVAGRVSVRVDDGAPVMLEGYFPHDWADPKQLWVPAVSGLAQGKHQAVVTLLDEHDPRGGTEFYFCAAAGTLRKDERK